MTEEPKVILDVDPSGAFEAWEESPGRLASLKYLGFPTAGDICFNPPGSRYDQVNPDLLERFWRKKGCLGVFRRSDTGAEIVSVPTPYGMLTCLFDDTLCERKGDTPCLKSKA